MATAGDSRGGGPERAFLDAPLPPSGPATLDPDESRHLIRSRRARVGDRVVIFDGRGGTVLGRVERADPRAAVVVIEGQYADREPPRPLEIAVSLPEAGRADHLVAMLAELGVSRLLPLVTERTPAGREDLARRRRGRWSRIVVEAAKVNGRSRLLEVGETIALPRLLEQGPAGLVLLDPDPASVPLATWLEGVSGPLPVLVVGPEGGYTEAEVASAAAAGAGRARIGHVALRTGTAAIAGAAIALGR